MLEISDLESQGIYVAKTKALISFAVTAKLICVFVFAYAKNRFSHNPAPTIKTANNKCTDYTVWEHRLSFTSVFSSKNKQVSSLCSSHYMSRVVRKSAFCICENKEADQLQLFATRIVQSLNFLNPKFQASSHLLWQYIPVCVGPGRKPRRPVFSQRGSFYYANVIRSCQTPVLYTGSKVLYSKLGFTGVYIINLISALKHRL